MNTHTPAHDILRVDPLAVLPCVRHGFFTRNGAPHETHGSTNYAFRTAEDTAAVTTAREKCVTSLDATLLITVQQRHTADVETVDLPWSWDNAPIADALVTRQRGLALGILTADCAPVLFADVNAGVIGAAHAGWRGALDGVVANTVDAMEELGAKAADIVAVVGPCIGVASYEVGPEFMATFVERDSSFAAYFTDDARAHFDLSRFVADRARAAGVKAVSVHGGDTLADEALFFSFRRATLRQEADYGRQISAIALV